MIALSDKVEVEKAIELTGGSVLKAMLDINGVVVVSND